jgi:hypothetical protein
MMAWICAYFGNHYCLKLPSVFLERLGGQADLTEHVSALFGANSGGNYVFASERFGASFKGVLSHEVFVTLIASSRAFT